MQDFPISIRTPMKSQAACDLGISMGILNAKVCWPALKTKLDWLQLDHQLPSAPPKLLNANLSSTNP